MRRPLLVVVTLTLALVACSGGSPAAAPAPDTTAVTETTVPATSSTVPPTTAKPTTTSSTVPRTTVTSQLTVGPGNAALTGTVTGPGGPVDGATVRVERLVGKSVATQDVTTVGGSWSLPSVLGGAYRVHAFRSPDLAPSDYQTFFLAANDRKEVDFMLTAATGDKILATITPSPARVGQTATLVVTVGTGRIDDQGRASVTPRPGVSLTLSGGAGYAIDSAATILTDGNGSAAWNIHCLIEGANSLPLTVGTGITSITVPACAAAPPPPATTTTKGP